MKIEVNDKSAKEEHVFPKLMHHKGLDAVILILGYGEDGHAKGVLLSKDVGHVSEVLYWSYLSNFHGSITLSND